MFDLVRERLGARIAFVNLGASFFINLLTLIAEIAGVALAIQLATDVNYLLWIPLVGVPRVARDLAGEVRVDGDDVRPHGPGDDRRRRRASWQLHPDWTRPVAPGVAPDGAERRGSPDLLLLTRSRCSARR